MPIDTRFKGSVYEYCNYPFIKCKVVRIVHFTYTRMNYNVEIELG